MWISLLLNNWRIIATVLALAAIFYRIDDRAYQSGVDDAFETCQNTTVPAARAWEQSECLKNIQRIEDSNAQNIRSKDLINDRYAAALKRLRGSQAAPKQHRVPSSAVDSSGTEGLPVPAEGGSLGERILELSRDAEIRSQEFVNCRAFVLDGKSD